jgi:glycosyltransferase involved in cell wall biosynthesis
MSDSVGVVIPAYNPDVSSLLDYICDIQSTISPKEIRVEIDDPSSESLDMLSANDIEISISEERRGKGAAIMAGFDALETDIYAFTDADGSVPASSLVSMLRPILNDGADVSIGSRRHPDSNIVNHQTILRRFLGDIFAKAARYILPTRCRDYQCGAKAVTANAWSSINHHCYESGFAWDLEFVSVAGLLGCKITEVPITWEDHPDSTVDPVTTSIELATALINVKRRADAIATSQKYDNVDVTVESNLLENDDY